MTHATKNQPQYMSLNVTVEPPPINDEWQYGWKFLNQMGGTNDSDPVREFYYELPKMDEKWSDWTMHPNPILDPDGRDCGPGRLHVMLSFSCVYAPYNWWPWRARWKKSMELGRSADKATVTGLQLRRINTKLLWRLIRGGILSGTSADRLTLYKPPLTGAMLEKTILRSAVLPSANFSGANMKCAELTDATLDYARFEYTELEGAAFVRARMRKVVLNRAEAACAYFTNADMMFATIRNSKLNGSVMQGANLTGATFDSTDLTGVSLRDADLSEATFNRCNMTNANLNGANVSTATFNNCTGRPVHLDAVIGRAAKMEIK